VKCGCTILVVAHGAQAEDGSSQRSAGAKGILPGAVPPGCRGDVALHLRGTGAPARASMVGRIDRFDQAVIDGAGLE